MHKTLMLFTSLSGADEVCRRDDDLFPAGESCDKVTGLIRHRRFQRLYELFY